MGGFSATKQEEQKEDWCILGVGFTKESLIQWPCQDLIAVPPAFIIYNLQFTIESLPHPSPPPPPRLCQVNYSAIGRPAVNSQEESTSAAVEAPK